MKFQSPSSINLFLQCPNAYRLHYIDHYAPLSLDDTPLKMGRSVHAICEHFYEGLDLNCEKPEEHFRDHLIQVAFSFWDRTIDAKKREDMDVALQNWLTVELTRFVRYKSLGILDRFKPIAVEEDLKVPTLGLHCIVDKRGVSADGKMYAWDYKTNQQLPPKKSFGSELDTIKIEFKVQAAINAMVLKAVGTPIENFYFQFIRYPDKLMPVPLTPQLFEEVQSYIDKVLSASEYPKNKTGCRVCNYKTYCECEQHSVFCMDNQGLFA